MSGPAVAHRRSRRAQRDLPPSDIYSEEYFLSGACEGLDEYLEGGISVVKQRELAALDARPGHRVLDLGCGRGEAAVELRRRGAEVVAVDYAVDAVRLTLRQLDVARVARADAGRLPFASGTFDRVLMGDVIEHLPWGHGCEALREVARVLAPGGRALIHTSPNTWFINLVMGPLRVFLRLAGRVEVLGRFDEYDRLRDQMHPNELNPVALPRLLREAGVRGTAWVDRDVLRSGGSEWTRHLSRSPLFRLIGRIAGTWPLRLLLGNDLYALIEPAPRP